MRTLSYYKTCIFDCDGVLLNSNLIKTEAFSICAKPFGVTAVEALTNYNKINGGVSRYKKLKWFFEDYLGKKSEVLYQEALKKFGNFVHQELLTCEITPELLKLRDTFSENNWSVVSGGDEKEIRVIFNKRKIDRIFNGGIFGSPLSKHYIFEKNFNNSNFNRPAVYIGDSQLDYEVSRDFDCDFVFLSEWTELKDWKTFVKTNKISHRKLLKDLLI